MTEYISIKKICLASAKLSGVNLDFEFARRLENPILLNTLCTVRKKQVSDNQVQYKYTCDCISYVQSY